MTTRSHTGSLLIVAGVLLTACGASAGDGGGDGDAGEVASLGTLADAVSDADGDGAGTSDEPSESELQEAALDFARCMREHGIDMPDPQFDTDGSGPGVLIQAGGPGSEIDPEQMEAANTACEPIMEKVRGQFEPPDPEQLEEIKQQALEFARCMREHGIDMPDPQFGEDGAMTIAVGAGRVGGDGDGPSPIDATEFEVASEACGGPGGGMIAVGAVDVGGGGDE